MHDSDILEYGCTVHSLVRFFLLSCPCSVIVDKTDKNGDGQVTQDELRDWVHHVAQRYKYQGLTLLLSLHT